MPLKGDHLIEKNGAAGSDGDHLARVARRHGRQCKQRVAPSDAWWWGLGFAQLPARQPAVSQPLPHAAQRGHKRRREPERANQERFVDVIERLHEATRA